MMPSYLFVEMHVSNGFVVVACLAILAQSLVLFRMFFGPRLRYQVSSPQPQHLDSQEFLGVLEALTDAKVNQRTGLQVFTNGEQFYEAELEAIRNAQCSVNLEAYIFQAGQVAQRFVDALTERARAGVQVRLLLDGLGSVGTKESYFQQLRAAGAKVGWYHPLRWHTLPDYNNRTHREVIVIDGRVAFLGGAGIADHWLIAKPDQQPWRDTMVRVEGDAAPNLQATFAENWLEATGELLVGADQFRLCEVDSDAAVLVINSTPSPGGASRARVLFQLLLASAQRSIHITTPYFLPDKSFSDELVRALGRGVEVKIVAPGRHSDHWLTRSSSRRAYGKLLQAGAEIVEYTPAMIHAKVLTVDGLWSVVGSTNCDHRSFGVNDEVNLAAMDRAFTARLEQDFARDVANSHRISYQEWSHRSLLERAPEVLGWVLERQQ